MLWYESAQLTHTVDGCVNAEGSVHHGGDDVGVQEAPGAVEAGQPGQHDRSRFFGNGRLRERISTKRAVRFWGMEHRNLIVVVAAVQRWPGERDVEVGDASAVPLVKDGDDPRPEHVDYLPRDRGTLEVDPASSPVRLVGPVVEPKKRLPAPSEVNNGLAPRDHVGARPDVVCPMQPEETRFNPLGAVGVALKTESCSSHGSDDYFGQPDAFPVRVAGPGQPGELNDGPLPRFPAPRREGVPPDVHRRRLFSLRLGSDMEGPVRHPTCGPIVS